MTLKGWGHRHPTLQTRKPSLTRLRNLPAVTRVVAGTPRMLVWLGLAPAPTVRLGRVAFETLFDFGRR